MSAPLYSFTLTKPIAFPAIRSGLIKGLRLLEAGVPYVICGKLLEQIQNADPNCEVATVPYKELTENSKDLLVLFPGGIGDIICLRPVLKQVKLLYPDIEISVASSLADYCLLYDLCTLWDYPLPLEIMKYFDAVVNVTDIETVDLELTTIFAEYFGVPLPSFPPDLPSQSKHQVEAIRRLIKSNKPIAAIQMKSASHYRSLPPFIGILAAMELVKNGFEVYIVGGPSERYAFVDKERKETTPPEGIYDYTKLLGTIENFIAFIRCVDLVITIDSAALHIAGVLGKPTLALFGMTHGRSRTSYYETVEFMQGEAECAPCFKVHTLSPCDNKWCLAMLNLDPVAIALKALEVYEKWKSI